MDGFGEVRDPGNEKKLVEGEAGMKLSRDLFPPGIGHGGGLMTEALLEVVEVVLGRGLEEVCKVGDRIRVGDLTGVVVALELLALLVVESFLER